MKNATPIILIVLIVLFALHSYHTSSILSDMRKDYIKTEEILTRKSDSLLNQIKLERKYTDSLIKVTKEKQVKIYNNYYEREKEYINADTINDSIIEYLSRRKFQRFTF